MAHRKKNHSLEPITLNITGLSHDGRGIARHQDKVVFVFGALPNEIVQAKITRSHSRYIEATVLTVSEASPLRVVPRCPHFGVCGGCQLQHIESNTQIVFKQNFLQEQLTHIAKVTPKEWLPPLTGDFYGYRQKARLGVRYVLKKEALLVGFREQKNSKVALIDNCHVLDPRVGFKITQLREMIVGLVGKEDIAQIEVAIGQEEVGLVIRHLAPLLIQDQTQLVEFCKANDFSLYLQPHGVESIHKIWPPDTQDHLTYHQNNQQLKFHFHPCDFTQVNQSMNQKMIDLALSLLAPNENDIILDLFCGLGNFSLPFAQKAGKVLGVEGTEVMVERAKHNARLNGLNNVEFHASDLEGEFLSQSWALEKYTKIILDPPRSGAQKIVENMSRFRPHEILYVSCNPATFTRDTAVLVNQHGYSLEKVGVMDMFPHTAHVETIALFKCNTKG